MKNSCQFSIVVGSVAILAHQTLQTNQTMPTTSLILRSFQKPKAAFSILESEII
jgi:hypothetical protein